MESETKTNEQGKSRPRSNGTAGSAVDSTLKDTARYVVNGKEVSCDEFFGIHLNGFK
jgi:hypothetical protein